MAQGIPTKAQPGEHIVDINASEMGPFPIPGATEGALTAMFLNQDLASGPIVAVMRMAPGSQIPEHYHQRTAEMVYVLEGDFVNNGVTYGAGTSFAHAPTVQHGPHGTVNGCTVMFMQGVQVDPSDFFIVKD
jgi:ChrR Cupin-like domain